MQYDSNVSIDEVDLARHKGDAEALFSLSARYSPLDTRKATLALGYSLDQVNNHDLTDYNLTIHGFTAGGTIRAGKLQIGMDAQYSQIVLDGDDYLGMVMVTPSLSGFATRHLFVRAAYTRLRKDFVTFHKLDADTDMWGLDVFRFIGRRKAYVALGVRRDDEHARSVEYTYGAWQGSLRVQVPVTALGKRARARFGFTYGERDYSGITPSIGAARHESRATWTLGLEVPLTAALTLRPQYRHVDRRSNVAAYDYRQDVVTGMLTWKL